MAYGQPDDICVTTCDAFHWVEGFILNGVSASLIKGVAAGDIGGDFFIAICSHLHVGAAKVRQEFTVAHPGGSQSRIYLVDPPAQPAQHFDCLCLVLRFPQDNLFLSSLFRSSQSLGSSQALDILSRPFARVGSLVDVSRLDPELPPTQ